MVVEIRVLPEDILLLIEAVEARRGFHRKKMHKLQESLNKKGVSMNESTYAKFIERDRALTRLHKILMDAQ